MPAVDTKRLNSKATQMEVFIVLYPFSRTKIMQRPGQSLVDLAWVKASPQHEQTVRSRR